jgi:hypothetical protein
MTRLALLSHRLSGVVWTDRGPFQDLNLYSLSFVFSDGSESPPMGTYNSRPTLQV